MTSEEKYEMVMQVIRYAYSQDTLTNLIGNALDKTAVAMVMVSDKDISMVATNRLGQDEERDRLFLDKLHTLLDENMDRILAECDAEVAAVEKKPPSGN